MTIKYTSKSTMVTTTKRFALEGCAPTKRSYAKRLFRPTALTVTYEQGSDGLKRTSWTISGPYILKDGSDSEYRGDASDWALETVGDFEEFERIAKHNAPWNRSES